MSTLEENEREKKSLLAETRHMSLLDGLYVLIHYNEYRRLLGPGPHCEAVDVVEHFSNYGAFEVTEAARNVFAMREAGIGLAESYMNGDTPRDQVSALRMLRAKHPGFSDGSYQSAFGFGCYLYK